MKAIIASALLLLAGCNTVPKVEDGEVQNWMLTCTVGKDLQVAIAGEVPYWELHTDADNPYLEVQLPGRTIVHYLQGGETCDMLEIEAPAQGGGNFLDPNA